MFPYFFFNTNVSNTTIFFKYRRTWWYCSYKAGAVPACNGWCVPAYGSPYVLVNAILKLLLPQNNYSSSSFSTSIFLTNSKLLVHIFQLSDLLSSLISHGVDCLGVSVVICYLVWRRPKSVFTFM